MHRILLVVLRQLPTAMSADARPRQPASAGVLYGARSTLTI